MPSGAFLPIIFLPAAKTGKILFVLHGGQSHQALLPFKISEAHSAMCPYVLSMQFFGCKLGPNSHEQDRAILVLV